MPSITDFLHHASELRFAHGFSIIPLQPQDKMPMIDWARYQTHPAALGEIEKWWSTTKTDDRCPNIGVVCGEVSERLIVIDVDPRKGGSVKKIEEVLGERLPPTVRAMSGGADGGTHLYFRDYAGKQPLKTFTITDGVEVRCDGSIIVVPPSIHPVTGNEYRWKFSPYDYEISQAPQRLLDAVQWIREKKSTEIDVEEYGPEPTKDEVDAVIAEVLTAISEDADEDAENIYSFITGIYPRGRVGGWDRSGWAYKLARLLIESTIIAVTEKRKLAVAVYGAAVHEAKFKHRTDRWLDCINIVKEAVAGEIILTFTGREATAVKPKKEIITFPAEVCKGVIGDIALALSERSEASLAYLFFSALAAFSALVSGNYTLDTTLKVKPIMYTILLGESGLSRKSVAISQVLDFFKESLGDSFKSRLFGGYFGSGEGVVKKLSVLGEKSEKGLAQMIWYVDEFEEVMSRSGMESSVLAPVLQQLYEDTNFEYFSLSKSLGVSNAHLSIISASTLDTFNSMWSGKMTEGGLFNRLWLVAPEQADRLVLPERAEDGHAELQTRLQDLIAEIEAGPEISFGDRSVKIPHARRLHMGEEARTVWGEFYLDELPSFVKADAECARRLDSYGLRLCVLLALSKGEFEEISVETVKDAILLLRYQFAVRCLLKPPDGKNDSARIEQLIMRKLATEGEMGRRELFYGSGCNRYGAGLFERALENLHKSGFVVVKRTKGDRNNVFVSLV